MKHKEEMNKREGRVIKREKEQKVNPHPHMTGKCDENVFRELECHYCFSFSVHFVFLTPLAARLPCE